MKEIKLKLIHEIKSILVQKFKCLSAGRIIVNLVTCDVINYEDIFIRFT